MRSQAELLNAAEISFASAESHENAARKPASVPSMGEAEFRAFYEQTAPQLRGYLRRVTGDASLADDLLQESYLRMLRTPLAPTEEAHRKHYLFRVATNLLRDHFRASEHSFAPLTENASPVSTDRDLSLERDFEKLLLELKPRERELLWLAYVEGYRHAEIAELINCRRASVRPMLFRARGRLAELLRARGWKRDSQGAAMP
ncbi:MAG TPA: RNA polymerase sigma factor [Candidatus Acidoferrales bacterium]|nr:RNA polymerase sigma factor [Candidatus Acidoferrales bacterium]